MNIHKLKNNPKKLKKLKTEELLEVFHLSNSELTTIMEKVSPEELKSHSNEDVKSWEKFVDNISETLDTRN